MTAYNFDLTFEDKKTSERREGFNLIKVEDWENSSSISSESYRENDPPTTYETNENSKVCLLMQNQEKVLQCKTNTL